MPRAEVVETKPVSPSLFLLRSLCMLRLTEAAVLLMGAYPPHPLPTPALRTPGQHQSLHLLWGRGEGGAWGIGGVRLRHGGVRRQGALTSVKAGWGRHSSRRYEPKRPIAATLPTRPVSRRGADRLAQTPARQDVTELVAASLRQPSPFPPAKPDSALAGVCSPRPRPSVSRVTMAGHGAI